MDNRIVIASGNAGKLKEIQTILADINITIVPQSDFDVPEANENGLSFVENALIKARQAAQHTGLPAIADDSGLIVKALQGKPGIHSARYAGEAASDEDNNAKLLTELTDVPPGERHAYFQCVMIYLRHTEDPTPMICQGRWQGKILLEPQGSYGFGYDPIFYIPRLQCSSAELPATEKNRLSHRGQALAELKQFFIDSLC